MATHDIALMGAVYPAVPQVILPVDGGGTATFTDVSDTTATAGDVLSGKYFYTAAGVLTAGTAIKGLVYETGTYTPESDVAKPFISFANAHSVRPAYILLSDTTGDTPSANSTTVFAFFDLYLPFGSTLVVPDSDPIYAMAFRIYEASTAPNGTWYRITSLTGSAAKSMPYWVTSTGFYPYGGSNSRLFREGRTYKWIAVWAGETT